MRTDTREDLTLPKAVSQHARNASHLQHEGRKACSCTDKSEGPCPSLPGADSRCSCTSGEFSGEGGPGESPDQCGRPEAPEGLGGNNDHVASKVGEMILWWK